MNYSAFKIKKLTIKMAEKKDRDAPELSGYEKEIDQWKEDLELARQQVKYKNSKIDQVICVVPISLIELTDNLRHFLNCRDSTYQVMTQERLYKTFYLATWIPLLSLMKCHWLVNKNTF